MIEVVGIRFEDIGKIYYFSPEDFEIKVGDKVVVETAMGVEMGKVVLGPKLVKEEEIIAPLKPISRLVTEEDLKNYEENKIDAEAGIKICEEKIANHNLEMEIIGAEYTLDRNKYIIYFTAEGRVDFRELVRDIASVFRTRIELRQIGVRDEAKKIGGIGVCGNQVCCKRFLGEFQHVSIQMAKDQGLSLNPSKISGVCGRLMCCLNYESDLYSESLKRMPEYGQIVYTPNGRGPVIDRNILTEEIKVRIKTDEDIEEIIEFKLEDIKMTKDKDSRFTPIEEFVDYNELKELEEE